jgi:hypothetical protein
MRVPLGVAAAVVLTTLGATGPATALPAQRSEPAKPDYGFSLEQPYLTSDVGGTLTVRPKVFTSRPDGSRVYVPEGAPVGTGMAIEYALPWDTSPVGLDEHKSCRKVKSAMDPGRRHIRCDTVTPLTIRVDKAFTADAGDVNFVPAVVPVDGENSQDDRADFLVTAPAPQEEGETEGSRAHREAVGTALLGVAGGFGVLALLLALGRTRVRRAVWVSCTATACTAAAVCAGLGIWSMVQGPLLGAKTYTWYPAGPALLETPRAIWDTSRILEEKRPDYVPAIATAPDPGHESVTEVSAFYSAEAAGVSRELWLALDGAYGRIENPRRARNQMLETAAGAPGVTVVKEPQLILLKDGSDSKKPVLFKCQALSIRDQAVTMCAWADSGVRALVTTADDTLLAAAWNANGLRGYVQLGERF